MTEMIVLDDPTGIIKSGWDSIALLFLFLIFFTSIIFYITYGKVRKRIIIPFLIAFTLVMIYVIGNFWIKLTYDHMFERTSQKEINFTELKYSNREIYYQENNTKYHFALGYEETDLFEKNFAGKKCVITYYKSSKAVIDIKILD